MAVYFVSDTHFDHHMILKYQKRPFRDVDHMNEMLISNWNDRVSHDDTIYHLGDFGFGDRDDLQKILDRLNGTKHLILGNHDQNSRDLVGWQSVGHYEEIRIEKDFVVLFHFAQRVWNKSHRGSISLYGHSHGSMPGNNQSVDIGVDCWDYRPVTFDEIKRRLKTLPRYTGYRDQAGGSDHHQPRFDDD